jgi:uncharacterized protein YdhG (YjbR/CyaY superfamily)
MKHQEIEKKMIAKNIDEYIARFPENTRKILGKLRSAIKKAAPGAQEVISYGMPAFKIGKILVYYAAHENHIGFYPTASGIEAFKEELAAWQGGKGSVRFPINEPLPLKLISEIVTFRVAEIREAENIKKKK